MKVSPVLRKIALEICGRPVSGRDQEPKSLVAGIAGIGASTAGLCCLPVTYLAEEYEEGRLVVGDEKLLSLIAAVFSNDKE